MKKKVALSAIVMMALLISCKEDKKPDNYIVATKVYASLYSNGKVNQNERMLLEEYLYDETGKITTMLRYRDAKGIESYKEEYEYNEANKIIASKYYAPNGDLWFSRSVTYHNDSTIAKIIEDVGGMHFTHQYKQGGGRSIKYNQEGQLQEDSTVLYIINGKNFSLVSKYEYGDGGLITSKTLFDNGTPIALCTYEYIRQEKQ